MLICAVLGRLHWSLWKWDVVSVFFNLHVVSKSPAEISTPIGTVLELRSRANLPCLVKLAPKVWYSLVWPLGQTKKQPPFSLIDDLSCPQVAIACVCSRSLICGRNGTPASPPASSWSWTLRILRHGWRRWERWKRCMLQYKEPRWALSRMPKPRKPLVWETSPLSGWNTTAILTVACSGQRGVGSSPLYTACPNPGVTTLSTCPLEVMWPSTGKHTSPRPRTHWWLWRTGAADSTSCGCVVCVCAASEEWNFLGSLPAY